MFFRVSAVVLAMIVASVVAAPGGTTINQCDTGTLSCCNTDGLGVLTCTPIDVLGAGSGEACTSQPVCCTNNSFNGIVNVGCSPINIAL